MNNKEKTHELADLLRVVDDSEFEKVITNWLHQYLRELEVDGMSEEQIELFYANKNQPGF